MAGKGIQGINIKLGADTTSLNNALKDVDKQSKSLQNELKQVDKALKLDPTNVQLVGQKYEVLQDTIKATEQRLDTLKKAQGQVEEQFRNGDIGTEQYRAFQRELATTAASLKSYEGKLSSAVAEQSKLEDNTKQLKTFFAATGTELDNFADVLGTRLTSAIREGSATSDQMGKALEIMGKKALGSSADIDRMRNSLRNVDAGASLKEIQQDLGRIAKEASEAGNSVNGFGEKLQGVAAGLMAGGGIAAVIEQALDVSSLNTQIDISMNLNEADTKAVRQSIMETTAAIGDEEAAYEGVRRQMTLNKDASLATNQEIIKGASAISYAYKEIDFKELIQESHEIGKELSISQKEALGLTNQLLSVGFPPEQLDIISEYGSQLKTAGFSAEEIQAIMAAGVETGTWNIDILLDGLKEGRIVAAEFGQGVDKAMKEALKGTKISADQLEKWGQAVAKGGDDGKKALVEMNTALMGIKDETKRNEIGVKLYGTLWEEQGTKISSTLQNMDKHMKTTGEMTGKLVEDTAKMDADPAQRLSTAIGSIKESLAPVLADVAELIAKIADWAKENTALAATVAAIVTVAGILAGLFAAFMPAISGLVGMIGGGTAAVAGLGAAFTVLTGPIGITIAAIAGIGVGLYALNEHMKQSSIETGDWTENVSEGTAKAVGGFMDLEKGATDALTQLKWSGGTLTQEMADDLIAKNNEMTTQVLTAMKERHASQLQEQKTYFDESNALSAEREAEILAKTQERNAQQEQATRDGQARINEILKTASAEKRSVTKEEFAEIDKINADLKNNAIKYLSESERDQKVIYETLKRNASELSAQQAADVVANSQKQKDQTIKDAEETYKKRVAAITKMRDEDKSITKEEADAMIKEAERSKNDTIKNASLMHQNVVKEAKAQAGEHVNQVNWETGQVKSKWDMFKGDVSRIWDSMGKGLDKALNTMWTGAKKLWGDIVDVFSKAIDKITGFFKGLKFEFPKPKMPPMPHFKMTGSFSLNPPSVPKLGIDWYAKGGIMTDPTAFGMNGSNLMVGGEKGREAILPLNARNLAGIGKGIAEQMDSRNQNIIIQPQPIYLDGQKIGEITYDTINGLQYNQTNLVALTKGVNI
ncbi:hypothetical protein ACIQGW_15965 [Lysinibacillus xylanilyticus]|uniref:hypothetical protein n=1 Tax=Lysinibacillus xylanilyticus TaxID=582475 RepID=UPI0038244F73